ncbi:MAG: hypothetical protein AB8H86_26200, partial [Polyangiales bacterium]
SLPDDEFTLLDTLLLTTDKGVLEIVHDNHVGPRVRSLQDASCFTIFGDWDDRTGEELRPVPNIDVGFKVTALLSASYIAPDEPIGFILFSGEEVRMECLTSPWTMDIEVDTAPILWPLMTCSLLGESSLQRVLITWWPARDEALV